MGDYHDGRGITLNSLKEQLYSLNMQMLLAIQNHNEEVQKKIEKQTAEVQGELDRMNLRGKNKNRNQ